MSPLRRPWIRPHEVIRWISSLDRALLPLTTERLDKQHATIYVRIHGNGPENLRSSPFLDHVSTS